MRLNQEMSFKLYTLMKKDEEYFAEAGMDLKEIARCCSEKLGFPVTDDQVKRGVRSAGLTYDPPGQVRGKASQHDEIVNRLDAIEATLRNLDERTASICHALVAGRFSTVTPGRPKSEGTDGRETDRETEASETGRTAPVEATPVGPVGGDSSVGPADDGKETPTQGSHTQRIFDRSRKG